MILNVKVEILFSFDDNRVESFEEEFEIKNFKLSLQDAINFGIEELLASKYKDKANNYLCHEIIGYR